jgi:hypothetical protein
MFACKYHTTWNWMGTGFHWYPNPQNLHWIHWAILIGWNMQFSSNSLFLKFHVKTRWKGRRHATNQPHRWPDSTWIYHLAIFQSTITAAGSALAGLIFILIANIYAAESTAFTALVTFRSLTNINWVNLFLAWRLYWTYSSLTSEVVELSDFTY